MVMRRFLPSLSGLQAFESAARHLNFTRAAKDIGMTQSGVSRQVKSLEEFLGVRLFERMGPRLILTESGQNYASEITEALDAIQVASIDLVRGRKANTALIIGALPSVASRWLAPRLDSFTTRHSDILIEIQQISNDINFDSSPVDIGILRGSRHWAAANTFLLFPEMISIVASPALIPVGTKLAPEEFGRFTLLQNASRSNLWLKWLAAAQVTHHGAIDGPRFAHTNMIVNAATSGMGIAVAPSFLVEKELETGELHTPFGPPIASGDGYYVVYPERKAHKKSILQFRDWLLSETSTQRKNLADN